MVKLKLRPVKYLNDISSAKDLPRVSKATTYHGTKGRFNGFDLGDGKVVGVFRQYHSNMFRILTRGDFITDDDVKLKHLLIRDLMLQGFA